MPHSDFSWLSTLQEQFESDLVKVEEMKLCLRKLSKVIKQNLTSTHLELFTLAAAPTQNANTTEPPFKKVKPSNDSVFKRGSSIKIDFDSIAKEWENLIPLIPSVNTHYYKYNSIWSNDARDTCYLVLVQVFFDKGILATPDDVFERVKGIPALLYNF
jgi:hypothetical protein